MSIKEKRNVSPIKHRLEDYEPGANQAHVFKALKKVAKSPKPSEKHD